MIAEFVGETLPTVALSTGAVSNDFKYLCLTLNSTTRIQVVAVAYIEDRLLVALPYTAWHRRTASKRALPALGKPCVVEVAWAQEEDREQIQDQTVKLWMGFLTADLVAMVDEDGEDGEFSHVFSESGFEECYPSGNGLVAAAMEHFAFQSAAEDIVQQVAAESGSHLLESRLGRLESLVGNLASKLDSALGDPILLWWKRLQLGRQLCEKGQNRMLSSLMSVFLLWIQVSWLQLFRQESMQAAFRRCNG